ncbi:hypothetical protein H5410_030381 [Solanum commersonii]|uniref:Uncharacterized protein n=1 Tax=Solanum commersonii TaxID=4109 RepID=A0A9J5YE57_SOLCO|nr:hypothetical protein H5410_030381 [Solanum commersonii]
MGEIVVSHNDVLENCNCGVNQLVLVAICQGARNYNFDISQWLIKANKVVIWRGFAGLCPPKSGRTMYFIVPSYSECISLASTPLIDIKKRLVDFFYENLRHGVVAALKAS